MRIKNNTKRIKECCYHCVDQFFSIDQLCVSTDETMPLASSREASLKREERVAAERTAEARRKRLSLPNTCKSSTVATEDKARRRMSMLSQARRDSIASFKAEQKKKRQEMAKENHYSPPMTRSTSKNKKQRVEEPAVKGTILSFSPPDQQENARREAEELRQKEEER